MNRAKSLLIATMLVSCGGDKQSAIQSPESADSQDVLSHTAQLGPVKATVSIRPKAPKIGDQLTLTLEVEAEPKVDIEMPPFGEALGRFIVVDYRHRQTTAQNGNLRQSQIYTLQASASGPQRIPPLRIEFLDRRPAKNRGTDAGVSSHTSRTPHRLRTPRELLTEPLAISVSSVLPSEDVTQLKPVRGRLEAQRSRSGFMRFLPWVILGILGFAIGLYTLFRSRRPKTRTRESAFDIARRQLSALEGQGLPTGDEVDTWYVELSAIIRTYLEDRYRVRAPELTTEEFLREAKQSAELRDEHRTLLSSFLAGCDRVKFAGYFPDEAESKAALVAAKRFVEETRPTPVAPQHQSGQQPLGQQP